MVVSSKSARGAACAEKRAGRKGRALFENLQALRRLCWKVVATFGQVSVVKALFPLISIGLVAFWSCKPAPGGSCDPGEARCLDAKREIICEDGKFVETPCKGKGGCSTLQERTTCDISGNEPGDPCSKAEEGVAVCSDDHAMLACHGRKFEKVPCRGPRGCEMVGAQANCDQSVAEAGDACRPLTAKAACSQDKTSVLSCKDGRMSELYRCRGANGCVSGGGKLSCDQTIAALGDTCDKGLSGHVACSVDNKALIKCEAERFVASEKCKPGTQCTVAGQSTSCTKP
jgi:hypothetical protein